MTDDRLTERRLQLKGRLIMAGVYLMITEVLTIAAVIGAIINFSWIVMPYEYFIPYYSVLLIKQYAFADGAVRPGLIFLGALAAAGFLLFYLIAFFMIKKNKGWANLVFAFYAIDTAALVVVSVVSFEPVVMSIIWNVINLGLHIYVLFGLNSARKAWHGLEVLPEKEIDEGDPYAEFRQRSEEEQPEEPEDSSGGEE